MDPPPPVVEEPDDDVGMTLSLWLQDSGVDQGWATLTWWSEIEAMNQVAMEKAERHVAAMRDVAMEGFDG